MTIVYIIDTSCNLTLSEYKNLAKYITVEKKKKLNMFSLDQDRTNSIVADIAIRLLLKTYFDYTQMGNIYYFNEYGKPFIKNGPFVSVSHSDKRVAIAISQKQIGIDIEIIEKINIEIAERIFTIQEQRYIKNSVNQLTSFLKIWTLKESLIKLDGRGLIMPLKSFSVVSNNELKSRIELQGNSYDLIPMKTDNYVIAICLESLTRLNFFCTSDIKELIKYWNMVN